MKLLDHLVDTAQELRQHTWRPSRATRFVVTHPKPREILAADFGDRVVHHLLVPWFERLFEPVFIHDSYANRRGKGSHAAVRRLQDFCRSGGSRELHYLQLDIANCFNSIDRRTLFGQLRARVDRDLRRPPDDPRHAEPTPAHEMLWLARVLLTGNPAQNAIFQGRPQDLAQVPAHKQLVNAPAEKGLPIGNLTSQFFANVYLNELDQFVKHRLKVRHYLRYVDDFVLLHDDPAQLERWRAAIADFLHARLGLALRDAGRLAPVGNGIDFLGYIVRADYLLARRRVLGHLDERLARCARRVKRADGRLVCPPASVDALQATLASYYGHLRHARTNRLQAQIFMRHPWLGHWLAPLGDGRLARVDRPARVASLAGQWRWFHRRYPNHVLLMQVGNRWECAVGAAAAAPTANRRPGLPPTLALPLDRVRALKRALTRAGRPWCEVAENGTLKGGLKRRQVVALWPAPPVPGPSIAAAAAPTSSSSLVSGVSS